MTLTLTQAEALTLWFSGGALFIALVVAGYSYHQTEAAKSSARSARDAEKRALKLERVMAFRWEIVPNGADRYLIFNAGTRTAHNVRVDLPDFLSGTEPRIQKLQPLERCEFVARVKPSYQLQVQVQLPRSIIVRWEDRDEKIAVKRIHRTTLAEYQPS